MKWINKKKKIFKCKKQNSKFHTHVWRNKIANKADREKCKIYINLIKHKIKILIIIKKFMK